MAGHSYAIADQFLSQQEIKAVLALEDFKKGIERFKKAGIGKQAGSSDKRSHTGRLYTMAG